ncbi:putative 2-amino-3-carboxymuconate-6-semialdehyde decarboxylase, metal-dependent hydrolase [Helianthus annuus]|nr:putative 2-amino-3-carboxymuconate-6-semialdehyde decarboxylase, metal-dependent hydrolase [Helianthus annuus]
MAIVRVNTTSLTPLISSRTFFPSSTFSFSSPPVFRTASTAAADMATTTTSTTKIIDSHLHVWASPQEAIEKFPYVPGQEPSIRGNFDFLLHCMEEAGVDGALIVQPINHKFDHSYVTSRVS